MMVLAGNCGYHVVPVQEILMSGRAKYQELLCIALAAQLAAQVTCRNWLSPVLPFKKGLALHIQGA